jgi:uncharacterized protein YbgA (DUF1722 family)
MGAPKLNHNLSLKVDKKTGGEQDSTRLKQEIQAYKEKIAEMLKDKAKVKKAVNVLEQMLGKKG